MSRQSFEMLDTKVSGARPLIAGTRLIRISLAPTRLRTPLALPYSTSLQCRSGSAALAAPLQFTSRPRVPMQYRG